MVSYIRNKKHNKEVGNFGEKIAKDYLIKQGYSILALNYRCVQGEIDIICQEKKTIIFVEVKTRTNSKFGKPFEAVDRRKIQRLYTVAQYYIMEKKLSEYTYRFDIISIIFNNQRNSKNDNTINYDDVYIDEKNYSVTQIKNVIF